MHRVAAPTSAGSPRLTQFQKFMPWVIIAPLGWPVVPEVYMMVTTSSCVSASRGAGWLRPASSAAS